MARVGFIVIACAIWLASCGSEPAQIPADASLTETVQGAAATEEDALSADNPADTLGSASEPETTGSASDPDPETVKLDEQWEQYDEQRNLFAADRYPLETPDSQCDDTGDCALGYIIGASFYGVQGVTLSDELAASGPVATLDDGSSALMLVGAEPAIYLILESPEGRDLLVSHDLPFNTTSKQRAVELRDDRCSIVDVIDDDSIANADCQTNVVSWYVGSVPLPSTVDDPYQLSQTQVNRTEPTEAALAEIAAALASGVDYETLRGDRSSTAAGPYRNAQDLLDDTMPQYCSDSDDGTCRAGYSIDEETADRATVTIVFQRSTPGSESRFETFYLYATLEQLAGAGWWWTEAGPIAVHQNGTGADGFADAEARFESCCDKITGDLQPPP